MNHVLPKVGLADLQFFHLLLQDVIGSIFPGEKHSTLSVADVVSNNFAGQHRFEVAKLLMAYNDFTSFPDKKLTEFFLEIGTFFLKLGNKGLQSVSPESVAKQRYTQIGYGYSTIIIYICIHMYIRIMFHYDSLESCRATPCLFPSYKENHSIKRTNWWVPRDQRWHSSAQWLPC